MSRETAQWLNSFTLIGFTDERGHAWHYREELQGDEPNHYPGSIPQEDIIRRLFDWEPVSEPLYVRNTDGSFHVIDGRQVIRRGTNGAALGVFKDGYAPHAYRSWLVEEPGSIVDTPTSDLAYGSAGLLKNGAQAWVSIETPETLELRAGIALRPHLLACTSLDGSLATTYRFVAQNVVCDNTLSAALCETTDVFRVKHTRNSALRIADAREALGIVHTMSDAFSEAVGRLLDDAVSQDRWSAVLDALVPFPKDAETDGSSRSMSLASAKRDALERLYRTDPRCAPWQGSAYGVLQAFNTYAHHESIVRNVSRAERNMSNALTGKTEAADARVLQVIAETAPVLA